ncbi:hypothetical protein Aros01_06917 [Streptosporangium roseum]|uniref:Uncharacterized protein n=1 Tax=Streptosporangium roseum (strain ATCC 12428 / DSM 43021 / JCM 3005 / KCTC 9067 / NCIMB 10171 / NRRL 2505 / NI 9100) TaxID=479432 RepID=D2B500_STRRD|nr:hypothetical protein Sros_2721 [Streptosporangium roseum DSM 43021]
MPAPVRYRSTAEVYAAGGADRGTTRARGSRSAPPLPSSVAGSIGTPAASPPVDRTATIGSLVKEVLDYQCVPTHS